MHGSLDVSRPSAGWGSMPPQWSKSSNISTSRGCGAFERVLFESGASSNRRADDAERRVQREVAVVPGGNFRRRDHAFEWTRTESEAGPATRQRPAARLRRRRSDPVGNGGRLRLVLRRRWQCAFERLRLEPSREVAEQDRRMGPRQKAKNDFTILELSLVILIETIQVAAVDVRPEAPQAYRGDVIGWLRALVYGRWERAVIEPSTAFAVLHS